MAWALDILRTVNGFSWFLDRGVVWWNGSVVETQPAHTTRRVGTRNETQKEKRKIGSRRPSSNRNSRATPIPNRGARSEPAHTRTHEAEPGVFRTHLVKGKCTHGGCRLL